MKTTKRFEIICWTLSLLPLLFTLLVYSRLPNQIPLHWNAAGEIDGWGPRYSALWQPLMTIGTNFLFLILPKIDPKRKNYESFGKAYGMFRLAFNLFMLGLCLFALYNAFNPNVPGSEKLVPVATGALFCVLGNYMPKFKHNYFVGIKTPWALASESVWRSTHRLGGALWFVGGLAMMITTFLPVYSEKFMVAICLIILVVPTVWSYICFKKEQNMNLSKQSENPDFKDEE